MTLLGPATKAALTRLAHGAASDLAPKILLHEMSATLQRRRLTGQGEGLESFNTPQLAQLCLSAKDLEAAPLVFHVTLISGLIDGDDALAEAAIREGSWPAEWTWLAEAREWAGDDAALHETLTKLPDRRISCAFVCLVAKHHPASIGRQTIGLFDRPRTGSVYLRLLLAALTATHGEAAATIATDAVRILLRRPEILFMGDVDGILALLAGAVPGPDPRTDLGPKLLNVAGDRTKTAIARRLFEHGNTRAAIKLIEGLSVLSPAYAQACPLLALAHLALNHGSEAVIWSQRIEDPALRAEVSYRVASAAGQSAEAITHLRELHRLHPDDAGAALQLLRDLLLARRVAEANQIIDGFSAALVDHPEIQAVGAQVRQLAGRAPAAP